VSEAGRAALQVHRAILRTRPELTAIYHGWFDRLLAALDGRRPLVEIGAGPGLLKSSRAGIVATDRVVLPWLDLVCDAGTLPFRSGSVGGLVLVDVLHHLPRPYRFLAEATRVLAPGGRIAAIEPWITPLSYVLYRWFHHERCRLGVNLEEPFGTGAKEELDGDAAIPFRLLRRLPALGLPLRLVALDRFLALPYLATCGFKVRRPLPPTLFRVARGLERAVNPWLRPLAATRAILIIEKLADGARAPSPPHG
jgi:SAM-dependent methyltransferase